MDPKMNLHMEQERCLQIQQFGITIFLFFFVMVYLNTVETFILTGIKVNGVSVKLAKETLANIYLLIYEHDAQVTPHTEPRKPIHKMYVHICESLSEYTPSSCKWIQIFSPCPLIKRIM